VLRNQVPRGGSSPSSFAVLRLVLSPRWLLWHVLTLGAMTACGFLAAWQWRRAGSAMGSAVNVGYGLQWPAFAVFFAWIWWRMLRIELARLREAQPAPVEPSRTAAAPGAPRAASPFAHRHGRVPQVTDADDPEMAEYNRMLAALAARDGETQD
jgi:DNA-binding transcriptional regulator of glucitol operon